MKESSGDREELKKPYATILHPYREETDLAQNPSKVQQLQLFNTEDLTEKPPIPFTHVCVVTWTDDVLSILAQAPIYGADRSGGRRVLFTGHLKGRNPVLEATDRAKKISSKNSGTGSSGPLMLV